MLWIKIKITDNNIHQIVEIKAIQKCQYCQLCVLMENSTGFSKTLRSQKKHNFSHFHSVSGKHCLNNRLAPANLGYAHPRLVNPGVAIGFGIKQ